MRPPKHGNCTVQNEDYKQNEITLEDFKEAFAQNKSSSFRKGHIKVLKEKMDGMIECGAWECEEVFEYDERPEIVDYIIYYIVGYLSRKLRTLKPYSDCSTCSEIFNSHQENLIYGCQEAELVNIVSRGRLTHPSMHLYNLLRKVELRFQEEVQAQTPNIYDNAIDKLLSKDFEKITYPCDQHKTTAISHLIHYYLMIRMCQFSKQENKKFAQISQERKKLAKLTHQ